jgi:hypothetical protein
VSRARSAVAKLALLLASSLAAVALVELVARRARPDLLIGSNERVHFCEYDAQLGWRNRAGAAGTFFGKQVVHNSLGQRDAERRLERSDETLRVMVLGDSFVWGFRLDAHDRFSNQLEAAIPGSEILNLGCSGYGQDQEYLLLRREIGRYRPDVVVVAIHVGSDLENNANSFQYGYHKPLYELDGERLVLGNVPVPTDSLGTRLNRWMTPRSALWNLLGDRRLGGRSVRNRIIQAVDVLSLAPVTEVVESKAQRTALTCELATAMHRLAVGGKAQALFVLIPDVGVEDQELRITRGYAVLRRCLAKEGVPTLDLEPVFRRARADRPSVRLTLTTDRHWSAAGNRIVSEALHEYFSTQGWLPATDASASLAR